MKQLVEVDPNSLGKPDPEVACDDGVVDRAVWLDPSGRFIGNWSSVEHCGLIDGGC